VKFFDTKYRLFGVLNLIDLVVVLALLAGAFAVYRVLAPKPEGPKASTGSDVTFEIVCPTLKKGFVSPGQIRIGDTISKNQGKPIGTVTGVNIVPTQGEVWDQAHSKIVTFQSTVSQDVIISVKTRGQATANGVVVGDSVLRSNEPMPVSTSTFECDTSYMANMKISGQ
jgi:Domain of unknown function (DUF4330)